MHEWWLVLLVEHELQRHVLPVHRGGNTGTISLRSFYNNGSTGRGVKWYSGTNYSGTYHGCTSTGYGSGNWASTTAPQVEPHGERPVLGQLVT